MAVDTFFVGVLKGVGKVYLQTAIDCHSRHTWARLYANKLPLIAVQTLNDDVLPTFEAEGATVEAVLNDNGREFCGREDQHPYELFLQLERIEHKRTKSNAGNPTALSSDCTARCSTSTSASKAAAPGSTPSKTRRAARSSKMQVVLDQYLIIYNTKRPHQGRGMKGTTPLQAFRDGIPKPQNEAPEANLKPAA
ncbi:integrase-like protein [Nitrospirillum amazonense]|uniref:Integrase-like protein n=1 Tax=Nitrospirillum amazonense TaxID=28077 RepID=A0A560KPI8_9PROT|nr:integrase-like protein [Nitrospirillum amazonense]